MSVDELTALDRTFLKRLQRVQNLVEPRVAPGQGHRRPRTVTTLQGGGSGGAGRRLRGRDEPEVGGVRVEREVGARPVRVPEVRGQDASQVVLAENDDMIEALAPHRADEPLGEGFCRGLCGAVRTFSIRRPFTRCRNGSP